MPKPLLRLRVLGLLLLLLLGAFTAHATHLMGGEMTYRYLDANGPASAPFRYEITIKIYTERFAAAQPRPAAEVAIYNRSQGNARLMLTALNGPVCSPGGSGINCLQGNLAIPRITQAEIVPPAPGNCAQPVTGVAVWFNTYRAIVNLPVSFDGYYAVFNDTARNTDVNNVATANNNTPMSLYSELAPPLIPNHSPVFSDTAVAVICRADTSYVLNNAFDADGDRLIYSFGAPSGQILTPTFTPPLSPVNYLAGHSLTQPFGPGQSYSVLNASTGLATYLAPNLGKYVVAVDVREYRRINGNEVLVGITRRDLQLVVRPCAANQSPVFAQGSGGQRSFTVEEGSTISFNLAGSDPDGQSLTLKASSVLLDGTGGYNATLGGQAGTLAGGIGSVTLAGSGSVSGALLFSPRCGDGRDTPYDVAVTITDCAGKSVATVFQIFVTKSTPPTALSGDEVICDATQVRTYTATGPPPPGGYRWRVEGGTIQGSTAGASIQVRWTNAGQGRVTVRNTSAFGCLSDSVSRVISVRPASTLAVTASAAAICPGQSATLTATGGTTYTWTGGSTPATGASITVSPTQTTTYSVTSGDGVCTTTRTITVTVNPAATANAGSPHAYCSGESTTIGAAALAGYTYQWSPATGLSDPTAANPTVTLTTGTAVTTQQYTLTATNAQGCTASATVTVTVNPAAQALVGNARTYCSGESATIGAAALAGYTYQWSPAAGLSDPTAANPTVTLTTGTAPTTRQYTLNVTNAQGCPASATVAVTVNPAAIAQAGTDRDVCSGTATQIGVASSVVASSTYQWSPATGLSDPTSATPTATLTNTTNASVIQTYTLTVRTNLGCEQTSTVRVRVFPDAVADAGAPRTICSGESTQLGNAASVVAGSTYAWSPAAGLNDPTSATPTATLTNTTSATIAQVYTLTVTTNQGCTRSVTVRVDVKPAAEARVSGPRTICSGSSTQIGAAALTGYRYQWSPATGLSDPTSPNPTVTLTNPSSTAPLTQQYTLTATNSFDCPATATVTVTVNPAVVVTAGAGRSVCSGDNTQLGAAALTGYTYQWSPATGLSSATVANPVFNRTLAAGPAPQDITYTLTATSPQGCPATATVTVRLNPAVTVNVGTNRSVCSGEGTQLGAAALAGYTYQWSPATGLSNPTAANPTVTLTNPSSTASLTQQYTLTATTPQGCPASATVTVTVNPRPVADDIEGSASVCPTVQGVAYRIRSPRGTAYQWEVVGGTIASGQGTNAITVNWGPASTTATVRAISTNQFGCSSDAAVFPVRVNPVLLTPRPSGPTTVCIANGPYTYSTQFTNGSVYTWRIVGGTQVSTNGASVVVNWTTPGVGQIEVTESSDPAGGRCLGTSTTLQVTVQPNPTQQAINGPARVCAGNPIAFSVAGATGSTYQWTLDGATVPNVSGSNLPLANLAPGTYTLTAQETNTSNCSGPVATRQFTIDPRPVAPVVSGPRAVCPEGLTNLSYSVGSSSAGSTYQWTVEGGTVTSGQGSGSVRIAFNAAAATRRVSVTETSQFGCDGPATSFALPLDNATVALNAATVDPANDRRITLNLAVANRTNNTDQVRILRRSLGSTGAFTQLGTVANSATSYDDVTADADAAAYEYRLELLNSCGTALSSVNHTTVRLEVADVQAGAGRNEDKVVLRWNAYQGFPVQRYEVYRRADGGAAELVETVTASAAPTYTVSFPTSTAGFNQHYRVRAVGAAQASASNEVEHAFANELQFYNVMTPNGDGLNEELTIKNVELYPGNTLAIYNRWGKQVYQTREYRNTWNGEKQPAGTYYFLFTDANGKATRGWFEIVR